MFTTLQLIYFFSPFPSSMTLASETALVAAESSPLINSPSWSGYCYKCYIQSFWPFFQGSGFPIFCSGIWFGFTCKMYIALQEPQAVALNLHKMTSWLSGKVVVYIWITGLLKLIFAIKMVQHLFFLSVTF